MVDYRFAKFIWHSARKDFLLGLPFVPLYSAAEVVIGFSAGVLIQLIFVQTPRVSVGHLIPQGLQNYLAFGQTLDRKDLVFVVPLILLGAAFVKLVGGFLSTYLIERAGHRVAHALRSEILAGVLRSPGNVNDNLSQVQLANQLLAETSQLQSSVSRGTINVIRDGAVVFSILLVLFVIAAKTMVILLFVLVPFLFILKKVSDNIAFFARESLKRQVELSSRILQTWNGRLTIHALNAQHVEKKILTSKFEEYFNFIKKSFLIRTGFKPAMELLATLLVVWMLVEKWQALPKASAVMPNVNLDAVDLAQNLGIAGTSGLTVGLILGAMAYRPLKQIAGVISSWQETKTVYQSLSQLWSRLTNGEQQDFRDKALNVAAEVSGLCYAAQSGKQILYNCNLKVALGKRVALVGPSGAGKTTLLRVLAGLVVPQAGKIIVHPSTLLATQTPYVFKGSVLENIAYADPVAVEKSAPALPVLSSSNSVVRNRVTQLLLRLKLAFSQSGAEVFCDKNVGYLGGNLSGGEKARVALARLLFREPKVLLLDEPTANLDRASAEAFWSAIGLWMSQDSERTIIAVSHQGHELVDFDEVYEVSEGTVRPRNEQPIPV